MLRRVRRSMSDRDQGFTLTELLMVISILGVLGAIAIPVFMNRRVQAIDASMKSDLRTVATAMEIYYVDNDMYPPLFGDVEGSAVGSTGRNFTENKQALVLTNGTKIYHVFPSAGVVPGKYCLSAVNPAGSSIFMQDSDGQRRSDVGCQ